LVITDKDSNLTHLEWIDVNNGKRIPFGSDPEGKVDLEGVVFTRNKLLATYFAGRRMVTCPLDPEFESALKELQQGQESSSDIRIQSTDDAGRRILFSRFKGSNPAETCLYDADHGTTRILWREQHKLNAADLCETRPIEYRASDGCLIPAYLTVPRNGMAPFPLVVFPHGGPRMRTRAGFDGRVQFLASRGYAVLQPNFRGSRGYGKTFMNAGDGQWGRGVMQTDVTDGVDHLIRTGLVDAKRVAIFGGSYGGYAALAGLAFTPDRYAAGISLFGISDLTAYATDSPIEWQAYAGDNARRLGDVSTPSGRGRLKDLSPLNHAPEFQAPLLIYHGLKDPLIPASHATQMVSALRTNPRSPVQCLIAPDEGHGFTRRESEMAVYHAIELFLHDHLGGMVGPAPEKDVLQRLDILQATGSALGKVHPDR
jgi:dipeptidyl aminopeptidase/acylaminoacyl peptidase